VTWTKLLANKEAQRHKTSKKELDNMRALIARDLADAGIAGLSADRDDVGEIYSNPTATPAVATTDLSFLEW
jgi:N-acyl-D-aspartate/D-glutamate deacylase